RTRPWFQLDRGGDAWPMLVDACANREHCFVTIRASYNRRVVATVGGRQQYLWPTVARQEPIGSYSLAVPSRRTRTGRLASVQVQTCAVRLDLVDPHRRRRHFAADVWAVRAREVGTTPSGEAPSEWLVL